jgi:hypothetical protein
MTSKLKRSVREYFSYNTTGIVNEYRFVKINDIDTVEECDTAGEFALGLATETRAANYVGPPTAVAINGVEWAEAGAAITLGDPITTDASGRAIKATHPGQAILGHSLSTASAAGQIVSVDLDNRKAVGTSTYPMVIELTALADTDETVVGTLPDTCIVHNVFLVVDTPEATDADNTLNVGTLSTDSGDADGFLDGVATTVAGVVKGTLASAGQTLGALLRADESGSGALVPEAYVGGGGKSITVTTDAAQTEFAGRLILLITEIE